MIIFPDIKNLFDLYEKFKSEQWDARDLTYSTSRVAGDMTGDYGPTWLDLNRLPAIQELSHKEKELFISEHAWYALCTSIEAEDVAARTCASEAEETPDRDARMALAMQVVDETRHFEVGRRILYAKYRDRDYVVLPAREKRWKDFLEKDYLRKLIGLHVITEGLAMGRFKNREFVSPDPVIREMYRRINLDEARHTALGMMYLGLKVKHLAAEERKKLEDFALERVVEDFHIYTDKMIYDDICRKVGLDSYDVVQQLHSTGLADVVRTEMNRRVMPKLNALGLLSERLRPKYASLGFRVDRKTPNTALMRHT